MIHSSHGFGKGFTGCQALSGMAAAGCCFADAQDGFGFGRQGDGAQLLYAHMVAQTLMRWEIWPRVLTNSRRKFFPMVH